MGTIVSALRPSFRLAKLEGDAAFTFAITEKLDGSLLLDTIERCYFRFRRRRRDMSQATSCECNACVRIPDLNLKFVVHHGTILRQRVAGQEELLGPDVILVHRLLKNDVIASTGIEAYALFSQQCVDAMDIDVSALGMRASSETYEHIGAVRVWIHDLGRRWQEEESRTRVIVDERHAVYRFDAPTSAPPQVAWEFMTTPGRRVTWQLGVTGVKVIATGNRRGVGATNHCMHGDGTIIEEVLDWRPYDYFTYRNTISTAMGPLHFLGDDGVRAHAQRDDPPSAIRGAQDAQGARHHGAGGLLDGGGSADGHNPSDRAAGRGARAPRSGRHRGAGAATSPTGWTGRRPVVDLVNGMMAG